MIPFIFNLMIADLGCETLSDIHQQSQMLQNANKTIAGIAAQTNILAMNAASGKITAHLENAKEISFAE